MNKKGNLFETDEKKMGKSTAAFREDECIDPGPFEDDPNLTDKKFPGNPTRSYRTKHPLRVVGEILEWRGHSPEVLQNMLDSLEKLKQLGIEAIND